MDIKTFNLEDLDLTNSGRNYYSKLYGESFPLPFLPLGPPRRRFVVKLDAVSKEDIRENVHDFINDLPNSDYYVNMFDDSEEFYTDSLRHQLYLFKIPIFPNPDMLNIYFRSKSEDKEVDDYLEASLESYLLKNSTKRKILDEKIQRDFPKEFLRLLKRLPELSKQEVLDLKSIPEDYRKGHIKFYSSMMFNTLGMMKQLGYSPEKALVIGERAKINSPFIFNTVKDCFN